MSERDEEETAPDGGYVEHPILMENRERLVAVEETQDRLVNAVDRVETKVDDVRETVEKVDEENLSRSRFEREYMGTIDQWDKYLTVVKWVAGAVIFLAAIVQVLHYGGVDVIA